MDFPNNSNASICSSLSHNTVPLFYTSIALRHATTLTFCYSAWTFEWKLSFFSKPCSVIFLCLNAIYSADRAQSPSFDFIFRYISFLYLHGDSWYGTLVDVKIQPVFNLSLCTIYTYTFQNLFLLSFFMTTNFDPTAISIPPPAIGITHQPSHLLFRTVLHKLVPLTVLSMNQSIITFCTRPLCVLSSEWH